MATLNKTLDEFSTVATVEDIDDCLKALDPHRDSDKSLINFWLDLRLTVMHNADNDDHTERVVK